MSYDWCNVLCRNLAADILDADLYALFVPYGTILSARVMWDPYYNCSKGYGFVRFSTPEEAQKAIRGMNSRSIRGKNMTCSVSYVQEDESDPPSDNLYIKYLPDQVDDQDLIEIFQPYGTILQCRVMVDTLTKSTKRFGFVRFSTIEEATEARKALNGKSVCDSPFLLNIKFAETPEQKAHRKYRKFVEPPLPMDYGTMNPYSKAASYPASFGGFIPGYTTSATPFIQITYCPYHPYHPHHPDLIEQVPQDLVFYGEGFVDEKLDYQKPNRLRRPKKNSTRPNTGTARNSAPSSNLFAFHIPTSIEKHEIEDLFARYGELKFLNLPMDKGMKKSKGYAFVSYVRLEDAIEARNSLDNYAFGPNHIRVDFNQESQTSPENPLINP